MKHAPLPYRRSGSTPFENQAGFSLVFGAIVFTAFLAVLGLAFDGAQLQWTALQAQKAADQMCLEAMSYREMVGRREILGINQAGTVVPTDASTAQNKLMKKGQEAALESLQKAGINTTLINVTANSSSDLYPDYDATADVLTAKVKVRRELYIMSMIPFINQQYKYAGAEAKCRLGESTSLLMVDLSGSMKCPRDTDCECLYDNTCPDPTAATDPMPANPAKVTALKAGVQSFVNTFVENRDQIAIMPFAVVAGDDATTKMNFVPFRAHSFSLNEVNTLINKFNVGTGAQAGVLRIGEGYNTNMADLFIRAYQHVVEKLADGILTPERTINYVLLSDSAPTAGRFFYANGHFGSGGGAYNHLDLSTALTSQHPVVWGTSDNYKRDYTQWDITYVWDFPDLYRPMHSFPSPLVATNIVVAPRANTWDTDFKWWYVNPQQNHELYDSFPPDDYNDAAYAALTRVQADCTGDNFDARGDGYLNDNNYDDPYIGAFKNCVDTLSFYGPPTAPGPYGGSAMTGTSYTADYRQYAYYRNEYYHAAVVWSDALRNLNANGGSTKFYVLGIGDPAPVGTNPYQFCSNCTDPTAICMFCEPTDASASIIDMGVSVSALSACQRYLDENEHAQSCPQENVHGDPTRSKFRKDVLLTRIAGDPRGSYPDFSFSGYTGWPTDYDERGTYIAVDDYDEAINALSAIGRNILHFTK